ncbi:MAG: TonB-dependent receptor plug domain-containing protein [Luteibaculaceae bacterium]
MQVENLFFRFIINTFARGFFLLPCIFLAALIFLPDSLSAQSDSTLKVKTLLFNESAFIEPKSKSESKILAASRSYREIEDLPFTIYVVTREEILKNGYTTLVDVLRNLPGFVTSQPGSALEGETFLSRGLFGNYYTKILVDNLPIQPSAVSGMPIGAQLPIRQAERIEIIMGPAAAIYGADAMAGVINIVTHSTDAKNYARADASAGQYGYRNFSMEAGGKYGKDNNILNYSIYSNSVQMRDLPIVRGHEEVYNPQSYVTIFSPFLQSENYFGSATLPEFADLRHNSNLIGAKVKYRGIQVSYDYMTRQDHSAIGLQPNRVSYSEPNTFVGETIQRLAFLSDYSLSPVFGDKVRLYTNLSLLRYQLKPGSSAVIIDGFNTESPGLNYISAASDDIYFEQLVNYKISKNFELLNGVTAQYSGNLPFFANNKRPFNYNEYRPFSNQLDVFPYNLTTFEPFRFAILGAFSQLYYAKGKTNAVLGVRYDYNTRYGSAVNPRVAVNQKIGENLTAIGSFGTAFRIPSSYYQYNTFQFIITPDNPLTPDSEFSIFGSPTSNPFLTPENFSSTELGFNLKLNEKANLQATIFYQLQTNLISNAQDTILGSLEVTSPVAFRVGFVNDENTRVEMFGTQLNLTVRNLIEPVNLGFNVFYTYTRGAETLAFNRGTFNGIRNMPEHLVKVTAFGNLSKKSFVNVDVIGASDFVGRTQLNNTIDGFTVVHFTYTCAISKNLNFFSSVRNVFNERYGGIGATGRIGQDLRYNPQMGRWFNLGLSIAVN